MSNNIAAGTLRFRPGHPNPVSGTRRPLANALLRGRDADDAPARLAALYSLCGDSHRIASRLAIDAARGLCNGPTDEERARLARETLREHVMRMWMDWPRLFGELEGAAGMAILRNFPLLQEGKTAEDAAQWVRDAVIGEDIEGWLHGWRNDPDAFLLAWAGRGATAPARLLMRVSDAAHSLEARSLPLLPHGDRRTLEALAAAMVAEPDFETLPNWQGGCCETGTWNRLANAGHSLGRYGRRAWFRLGARVAEAALLASGTPRALSAGAAQISRGTGIAWCEMARGLLLHRVSLGMEGERQTVADYRVVAPTEWNFHPGGAAAEMLAQLPAGAEDKAAQQALAGKVNIVAAAFDPCVAFEVEAANA